MAVLRLKTERPIGGRMSTANGIPPYRTPFMTPKLIHLKSFSYRCPQTFSAARPSRHRLFTNLLRFTERWRASLGSLRPTGNCRRPAPIQAIFGPQLTFIDVLAACTPPILLFAPIPKQRRPFMAWPSRYSTFVLKWSF